MLEFSISSKLKDGWSNEIEGIAQIENNILKFNPDNKNYIGEQIIFIRSTDSEGESTIQELRLNIINVNDPQELFEKMQF